MLERTFTNTYATSGWPRRRTSRRRLLGLAAAALFVAPVHPIGAQTATTGAEGATEATQMQDGAEFLLLHGAFHVGDAWDGVIAGLADAGHVARAITFPGHGKTVERGGVEFRDYEEALVAALNQGEKPVIVVGHSAAGVVMQAAAPKATDKVAALVFHNAFLLGDGLSMIESVPPDIAEQFRAAAAASPDNSLPVNEGFIRHVLMAGAREEMIELVLSRLVPQPFGYYTHKIATGAFDAMGKPRYLLLATDDESLPQAAWRGMAHAMGEHVVVEIPGGHEVLYTDPEAVVAGLLEIARDLNSP